MKPLNKKSEVKKAEVEYLQSIFQKERVSPEEDDFEVGGDLEIDNLIEEERRRIGVPDNAALTGKDLKETQLILQKVRNINT